MDIKYKRGFLNTNADALSCIEIEKSEDIDPTKLKGKTNKTPSELISYLLKLMN